jgi:hypothetical protein
MYSLLLKAVRLITASAFNSFSKEECLKTVQVSYLCSWRIDIFGYVL